MRWRLLALLTILLGLGAATRARRVEVAPHERWGQGECESCHDDPPKRHRAPSWDLTHGRTDDAGASACATCHPAQTCTGCHSRPPATHAPGFRRPGHGAPDGRRHALLARARPSACLVCHQGLGQGCAGCHGLGEFDAWSEAGGNGG